MVRLLPPIAALPLPRLKAELLPLQRVALLPLRLRLLHLRLLLHRNSGS